LPDLPEDAASALCYTSGTTGDPKGALYSHRSSLMHAFSVVLGAPQCFGAGQRVLPVVPLFHVNAWGLPYAAPLSATELVFPGPRLDGASIYDVMQSEGVTTAWGVPTVWAGLIEEMRRRRQKPDTLRALMIGGSAVAPAMIRALEVEFGIEVLHGWGMTEMSPVGTITRPVPETDQDIRIASRIPQGKRLFGVDLKIVDDDGQRLPHDGVAQGELLVRGGAVISAYFNAPQASAAAFDGEGWFRTGDVARITPQGDLVIVDRTKDLIKSGGEWISSIDLENAALSHPSVALAAAVAVPHPKWDERPVLAVVLRPGTMATQAEILAHMAQSMAKWQLPDDVAFVEALPMTATGKISKTDLRVRLKDHFRPEAG
jgi:3-(methylthio)propionyl---CoA ligase